MRVLICDDNEMMRKTLKMFLSRDGHEIVAECTNGLEAIDQYEETLPEVCLLDISMPELDGIAALKKIHANHPDVKAIMCTARDDQVSIMEAIQNGAVDFVEKPFTPSRLKEAFAKLNA